MPKKGSFRGRYFKGAKFERELAKMLVDRGYLVVRAAGSGVYQTAPDLLAFKGNEYYVFECKAWSSEYLNIKEDQYKLLKEWSEKTGLSVYIAWRVPKEGWYFIRPEELSENRSITLEKARMIGRRIDDLV